MDALEVANKLDRLPYHHHDGDDSDGDDSDGEPTERRGYDVPKTRLPLTRLEKGDPWSAVSTMRPIHVARSRWPRRTRRRFQ
jgi:hypothetical protein